MNIVETEKFKNELRDIALFIKKDNKNASIRFVENLRSGIYDLVVFPYKYRQSIYFESKSVRDMIFHGYTIVYEVFEDRIEVLSIFNQNKPTK